MEIGPVIVQSLKLLRASLPATVEIVREIDDTCPLIRANSTQVNQVIMNLCTNAAHAIGDRPGRIDIMCKGVQLGEDAALIHPRLSPGLYVRITVSDNGQGMSQETQSRVFEPFFTTKPQGEGTGLGLTMVHGILEVHDGAITLDSREGRGTSFHLYFPALSESEAPATRSLADLCRGDGEHILFVDDDKGIVHLARAMLKRLGYRVTAFNGPLEAAAAFEEEPERYNLIIADLTMPDMTGLALAERIHRFRPDVPFLLITGYAGALENASTEDYGIQGVLYKPFSHTALARSIYNLLKPLKRQQKMEA
jgi:CheY-like chemotaxis protein